MVSIARSGRCGRVASKCAPFPSTPWSDRAMAVLPGVRYPDERLKREAAPVTRFDEELRRFLAEFEETMRANPGCVALAAPQVGRSERIVIVDVSRRPNTPN